MKRSFTAAFLSAATAAGLLVGQSAARPAEKTFDYPFKPVPFTRMWTT